MLVVEHHDTDEKGKKKNVFATCGSIAVVAFLLLVISAMILPNFTRPHRHQGRFTQCQSNMKNIATALEMYSTDNQGEYPINMRKLLPYYLKTMPTCSETGTDTYSNTYSISKKYDAYTFYCRGKNHEKVGIKVPNYPQYSSVTGLIPRP